MGRAMRDFVFVYLPLYLRGFAIFLIFASPVLAALHFHDALCYFDKVVYYVPSFGLFALSVIWIVYGYGLEKYIDYEQNLKRPLGRATLPRRRPLRYHHYRNSDRAVFCYRHNAELLSAVSAHNKR